jgi:FkbM family methyltransferase
MIDAVASAAGPDRVLYDVGAHIGLVTCVWAKQGGRAIAFEPNPVNVDILQRVVELNGLPHVAVRRVALADSEGSAKFVVNQSSAGTASAGYLAGVGGDVAGLSRSNENAFSVDVTSIDRLLERGEVPPPTVIKIDVEGAECAVVRGALAAIRTHRPTLIIEVHNVWAAIELTQLLVPLNYRVENLSPGADLPQTVWRPL